jgi:putative Mn2+ efflux pump MntP
MPLIGMLLADPLSHLAGSPTHLIIDPYQLGSTAEANQLRLAYHAHLADSIDLTFVGRYIVPIIVPLVVGVIGLLMLDEAFNDDDDDDDEAEKARALVGASGLSMIGLGLGISIDEFAIGFTLGLTSFPVADVIITIVIQAFLAFMLGQYLGKKARAGNLRISSERINLGSKLLAGGVLVLLSAGLLLGPPIDSHLIPHFVHHRKVPTSAPSAVSTSDP